MSVRDRLEAQERQKAEQALPQRPNSQSQTNLALPSSSTRETQLVKDFQTAGRERLAPPEHSGGGTGAFTAANAPLSTREWTERKAAQEQVENETPRGRPLSAAMEYWLAVYEKEKAEKQAAEAAELKAAQERAAKETAAGEKHLWMIGVEDALTAIQATPDERQRALNSPAVKVGDDPNKVAGIVLTLRSCKAGAKKLGF